MIHFLIGSLLYEHAACRPVFLPWGGGGSVMLMLKVPQKLLRLLQSSRKERQNCSTLWKCNHHSSSSKSLKRNSGLVKVIISVSHLLDNSVSLKCLRPSEVVPHSFPESTNCLLLRGLFLDICSDVRQKGRTYYRTTRSMWETKPKKQNKKKQDKQNKQTNKKAWKLTKGNKRFGYSMVVNEGNDTFSCAGYWKVCALSIVIWAGGSYLALLQEVLSSSIYCDGHL